MNVITPVLNVFNHLTDRAIKNAPIIVDARSKAAIPFNFGPRNVCIIVRGRDRVAERGCVSVCVSRGWVAVFVSWGWVVAAPAIVCGRTTGEFSDVSVAGRDMIGIIYCLIISKLIFKMMTSSQETVFFKKNIK